MTDYYKILGVDKIATQEEIKKAYRKLCIKFHPDKNNGDPFFENIFKQVQDAYAILGNINTRSEYDLSIEKNRYIFNHKKEQSNHYPFIELFISDKQFIYNGEVITFQWKVYSADIIEIKPFGFVNSTGIKTYKINSSNREFIKVELIARNSIFSTSNSKLITVKIIQYDTEKFWSFKGRIGRLKYFFRLFFIFIIFCCSYILFNEYNGAVPFIYFILFSLFLLIVVFLQSIKRLHDLNLSGWWCLVLLIPYLNIFGGLYIIFGIGAKGTNIYGPDPDPY